ncbi:MAG: YceI family protein [Deltaproteobacteria bacterium]|nr:YceI family protein [Deltaproteobacteria bacterium]
MATYDAGSATCHVFTFKEGVLSAIAHDLRLRVDRFTVDVGDDGQSVEARFEADSLRVDCAMKDGREAFGTLRDGQKRDIERNIVADVLHARRHRTVVFRSMRIEGEGDVRQVEGTLSLHGVDRPVRTEARRTAGRWTAEIELHQPDHGIRPYSAMLGTLKIRPRVRVRISVPQ